MIAAFVGIGMAVTIAVSFLLVIPIEPVYWIMAIPTGLLIGYYAQAKSGLGRGAWRRMLPNALFAGAVTGLTLAALLIGIKALFFVADDGYRDPGLGGRISCTSGADCVYKRYLATQPEALANAGVADAATFSNYYWAQQWSTAEWLLLLSAAFSVAGGVVYGLTRPKADRSAQPPGVVPAA